MRTRTTRDEWAERVSGWKASGLSCAQFAKRAGVQPGTLSWWRWKLKQERGRPRRRPAEVAFVELRAQPTTTELAPGAAALELRVGALTLRVAEGFEAQTLARVLDVLEARR